MKLLELSACKPTLLFNHTYANRETWSDPGVYPSGAGVGPKPSYDYMDIGGTFGVQFTDEQLSSLAFHFQLVDEFTPMTAGIVMEVLGYDDWPETIFDWFTKKEIFGISSVTVKAEAKYEGNGTFTITILEAEC